LAAQLWDELYDQERRWSYRELAQKTHGIVSSSTVWNMFAGRPWQWAVGKALIAALGGDLDVWEQRWSTTRTEEDQRRLAEGLEPLPWVDQDDPDVPIGGRAVHDWDVRRFPSPRFWLRAAGASVGAATVAASSLLFGTWTSIVVAAILLSAVVTINGVRHRRSRNPSVWRQVILRDVRHQAEEIYAWSQVVHELSPQFQRLSYSSGGNDPKSTPVEPGTTIQELFNEVATLVLLGEPGLGKSTQLAKLAYALTEEDLSRLAAGPPDSEPDETEPTVHANKSRIGVLSRWRRVRIRSASEAWWDHKPLPFLLDLSTYRGQSLEDWIVAGINLTYDYASEQVRSWLVKPGILPLLDGLDRVPEPYRADCVKQIRTYRQRGRGVVIACRSRDHRLARKINALQYIEIVAPSRPQVQEYLTSTRANPSALADVRAALEENDALWDLLRSPLMLNIIHFTYANRPATELRQPGIDPHERRSRIFDAYLRRMLDRHSPYTRAVTIKWLYWLASRLACRNESVLHLDRLDETWVSDEHVSLVRLAPRNIVLSAVSVFVPAWLAVAYWMRVLPVARPLPTLVLLAVSPIFSLAHLMYSAHSAKSVRLGKSSTDVISPTFS
jgi:hypothetical protein